MEKTILCTYKKYIIQVKEKQSVMKDGIPKTFLIIDINFI